MRRHHLTLTASAAAAAVLLGAIPADAGRAATATVTLLNDGRCDPMTAAWNLSWGTARVRFVDVEYSVHGDDPGTGAYEYEAVTLPVTKAKRSLTGTWAATQTWPDEFLTSVSFLLRDERMRVIARASGYGKCYGGGSIG